MTAEPYALSDFIADLDRITREERSGRAIAGQVAPLLGRLVKNPESVPLVYCTRPADGGRGRYMLHRAPAFNVTSVVWRPGDRAACHNHETWGVIGVIDNEIEETRYRVRVRPGHKAAVEVTSVTRYGPGAVSCLIPGEDEIHGMHNPTDRDTVEIHVYGRDLHGLRRKTWDADGTEKPLVSGPYLNC
jgi:predicted metal-dependent enzyme (double-stranded beta helix superfamily)